MSEFGQIRLSVISSGYTYHCEFAGCIRTGGDSQEALTGRNQMSMIELAPGLWILNLVLLHIVRIRCTRTCGGTFLWIDDRIEGNTLSGGKGEQIAACHLVAIAIF